MIGSSHWENTRIRLLHLRRTYRYFWLPFKDEEENLGSKDSLSQTNVVNTGHHARDMYVTHGRRSSSVQNLESARLTTHDFTTWILREAEAAGKEKAQYLQK